MSDDKKSALSFNRRDMLLGAAGLTLAAGAVKAQQVSPPLVPQIPFNYPETNSSMKRLLI